MNQIKTLIFFQSTLFSSCGPMGVQRAFYFLLNLYSFNQCHFEGFNFYLSKQSHSDWYPSLRKIEYGNSHYKAIMIANMEHDYLLNFSFMKKLIENSGSECTGEIVDLVNIDINEIFSRFSGNLGK